MSSYCGPQSQQCPENCCDKMGQCPQVSGQSCYYYYSTPQEGLSVGAITGIVVGCVALLSLIPIALWCYKRQKKLVHTVAPVSEQREYAPKSIKVARSQKTVRIEINVLAPAATSEQPRLAELELKSQESEVRQLHKYEEQVKPQTIYVPTTVKGIEVSDLLSPGQAP